MSTQTLFKSTGKTEIHQMLDNLTGILDLELQYSRKFTEVLRCRVEAEDRDDFNERELCLVAEKELLGNLAMIDRERVAAVGELSLAFGCRREKPMRIAELILYVDPEYRDALLDVRELIRDCADEIESLNNANNRFQRLSAAGMDLYLGVDCGASVDLEEVLAFEETESTGLQQEVEPSLADLQEEELPEGFNALLDEIFGED